MILMASATLASASRPILNPNAELSVVNKGCKLVGCGSAVPSLRISNDDLSKMVDTNDEWISTRTGIRHRRVLSGKESLTSLAVEASRKALEMGEVDPEDVDLILLCSSTPDELFGNAPQITMKYNTAGGFKNVLVIGADAISRFVDWSDRGSCILFGDAAAAVLIQECDISEDFLFSCDFHSNGEGLRHLSCPLKEDGTNHSPTTNGFPHKGGFSYSRLQMNGKEVFKFAVGVVPQSIKAALGKTALALSDIDWLLLHQANQRIIDAVAARMEFPAERVISNLVNYGNTSAASIPLALDEAVRAGKIQAGHTIAAAGFGAGLTWGSAIILWR
nr:3-oxoacyl-[acyl-carrier-protein] synthase 3 A, chloroplastic-like [Ipomoea batatas]GMD85630.1 3-oxoacyl-[acyl-carrier-protein] synthase 3 A, chloroplastic-like [Ipomoea batatas]GMD85633.1 3-oxoacyl-[acyl-carrier-protein] synthase 3 A, chloroplastic-like [Ipomoea batatas]